MTAAADLRAALVALLDMVDPQEPLVVATGAPLLLKQIAPWDPDVVTRARTALSSASAAPTALTAPTTPTTPAELTTLVEMAFDLLDFGEPHAGYGNPKQRDFLVRARSAGIRPVEERTA